jgi:hypothetical protein
MNPQAVNSDVGCYGGALPLGCDARHSWRRECDRRRQMAFIETRQAHPIGLLFREFAAATTENLVNRVVSMRDYSLRRG